MAPDHPFDGFVAAARGAVAHLHLPVIHIPGSNSSPHPNSKQHKGLEVDCLLHLHVLVTNFLHKPLKSFARCFRPKRRTDTHSPPLHQEPSNGATPQKQLEFLLCIAFDAFAHNLHALDDACKHKGEEFAAATRQLEQFVVLRKVIDGKRADFDGFLSNLGFAKVGAPPPPASIVGGASPVPASAPVSNQEDGAVIGNGEGVDSASGTQQQAQKLPARLLNIPLSNVERLRSTLSAVSLTELIELVPLLVSRSSTSADAHPDKKKLFSVQDFFRYAEIEGNIIFSFSNREVSSFLLLQYVDSWSAIANHVFILPYGTSREIIKLDQSLLVLHRRLKCQFYSRSNYIMYNLISRVLQIFRFRICHSYLQFTA
jgi:hypothetical protein